MNHCSVSILTMKVSCLFANNNDIYSVSHTTSVINCHLVIVKFEFFCLVRAFQE